MDFVDFVGYSLVGVFAIYVAVRVASAAFYQSRKDFEKGN